MAGVTAFLGDLHGDLEALHWAVEATASASQRVCLGDVVDGRDDVACMQLLRDLQVLVLMGNHDAWAAREQRLPAADRAWLSGLPLFHVQDDWRAFHSAYRVHEGDDEPSWIYLLDDREIRRAFAGCKERVLFCGHSHIPSVNILLPDGSLAYRGADWLRHHREVPLEPGLRYLVCAGCCDECLVTHDGARLRVTFVFRPQEPLESWLSATTAGIRLPGPGSLSRKEVPPWTTSSH